MKQLLQILLCCAIMFECSTKNKTDKSKVKESYETKAPEKRIDSTAINNTIDSEVIKCNCKSIKFNPNYSTDITFQNSKYAEAKNDSIFAMWSNDSLRNKVKSIRFSGFDTIPEKYSIFKEVNKLSISARSGINGLDMFPKLKSIYFFGSIINLNSNEKWLNKIEVLIGQKTKFIGLTSFKKTQNLTSIYFGFSGFDNFPKDINSLSCLNEITLGAYMFGKINLNELDLSENLCLRKVEIQAWQNTLKGIPKGLTNPNIKELKISHQQLTEFEKEKLKDIKANWQHYKK